MDTGRTRELVRVYAFGFSSDAVNQISPSTGGGHMTEDSMKDEEA